MIDIVDVRFIKSAQSISDSPPPLLGEVAFLGRSNVGKSSIINALSKRKNLAKSSKTPGKTRLLNFFELEAKVGELTLKCNLVDLPGYGFAKVSKSLKEEWNSNLFYFLQKRDSLKLFIHLVDSRHTALPNDLEAEEFLANIIKTRGDTNYLKVFTKSDKLKQSELAKLKNSNPNSPIVSAEKKRGIDELRVTIFEHLFELKSGDA
ncbi:MAG: ribosome biogenesis GTP-binding protein YihA/YsxC [Campylobacterales bacterium]